MRDIRQECTQEYYFRRVEMLAHFKKSTAERLPLELWFNADEEDHVTRKFGCDIRQKLIGGPDNCTLYSIHEFDCWSGFRENKKIFRVDLCNFGWCPPVN